MDNKAGITLSKLSPPTGSRHRRKRLGIGEGSGNGKTCGKGHKGQKARAGGRVARGFEGGQMPIHRRLPKVGFTSRKRVRGENAYQLVSISNLETLDAPTGIVSINELHESGIIRNKNLKVKILGGSSISKKIIVEAHAFSKSAKESLEAAGGEARELKSR
jgi:large subunit ribosomal protein L15